MALKAVGARTEGDVYQGLFFWRHAASLLAPNSCVQRVELEHDAASGVDDVAVFYKPPGADAGGRLVSSDFYQLKYHVDRRDAYSAAALIDPAFINSKTSLLQRFYESYKKLAGGGGLRLHLASNWGLKDDDALARAILEFDGALPDRFFTDGDRTVLGKAREEWRAHLGLDRAEFELFGRSLRLQFNHFGRRHFREWVYTELKLVGLRVPGGDQVASPYDSLVQAFVMNGTNSFDAAALRDLCAREGLLEPGHEPRRPPTIGIRSFIRFAERIEEETDSHVCVARHFEGRHPRLDSSWQESAAAIVAYLGDADRRSALRASDHAVVLECHGSLALVAGYELSRNSGCAAFPVQKPGRVLWKPDPPEGAASPSWRVDETARDASATDIAVALSVTHSIMADVQRYLDTPGSPQVRLLVNAAPAAGPGSGSVKGASQAWQMAGDLVATLRRLRPVPTARVHLFSSAPNALLFFLGQYREALGRLELYEYDFGLERDGSYQPSVSLPLSVGAQPPEVLNGTGI